MSRNQLIVLKLGSSVLTPKSDGSGPITNPLAIHEIYRWVRRGFRVLAVVSAPRGETDRLFAQGRALCDRPSARTGEHALAQLVATGEIRAAAALALALEHHGIPAQAIDAYALGLHTAGATLDADPVALDDVAIRAALDRVGVVVVPGFVGCDARRAPTLLGRGGSDLTALCLAHRLNADRCRLLKDVDGLYETDPKPHGLVHNAAPPRRFAQLSWHDLPRLGSRAVQPKAAAYARTHKVTFEVAAPLSDAPTLVGPFITRLDPTQAHPAPGPRPLRVILLGHGVVGAGVAATLASLPDRVEIVRIAVRDPAKHVAALAAVGLPPDLLTSDAAAAIHEPADLVIEAIGGVEPAHALLQSALNARKHVVTANKALIAQHGPALAQLARHRGRQLLFSAAVGAAVPMLERVSALARRSPIVSIRGVLNATSNAVLTRLHRPAHAPGALAVAVTEARDAGFAEADPSRDLQGLDALDKLTLLTRAAGLRPSAADTQTPDADTPTPPDRSRQLAPRLDAIDGQTPARAADAARRGKVLRQVASASIQEGTLHLAVTLEPLEPHDPLAQAVNEENALCVRTADGHEHLLNGRGAGRAPTAISVVADVLDLDVLRRQPDEVHRHEEPRRTPDSTPQRPSAQSLPIPQRSIA